MHSLIKSDLNAFLNEIKLSVKSCSCGYVYVDMPLSSVNFSISLRINYFPSPKFSFGSGGFLKKVVSRPNNFPNGKGLSY